MVSGQWSEVVGWAGVPAQLLSMFDQLGDLLGCIFRASIDLRRLLVDRVGLWIGHDGSDQPLAVETVFLAAAAAVRRVVVAARLAVVAVARTDFFADVAVLFAPL